MMLGLLLARAGVQVTVLEKHADFLREAGCTYGQGYLWSRPVPAADLLAAVRRGELPATA